MKSNSLVGTLYLIPSPIIPGNTGTIPKDTLFVLINIRHLVVERARTTRRAIKTLIPQADIDQYQMLECGNTITQDIIDQTLKWLFKGHDVGIMSEAGSPAIADPGANLIFQAHQKSIKIKSLVGPNSILQALMASGLNGQAFLFHGYLPNKKPLLQKKIQEITQVKSQKYLTHICIEAPYRNRFLFSELKMQLPSNYYLCVASAINSPEEWVQTKKLADWKMEEIDKIHKVPAIFLFAITK